MSLRVMKRGAPDGGVGRLRWQSEPPNGPVAVTGMDVVHFENGRIHSLYVFLDPKGALTSVHNKGDGMNLRARFYRA